MSSTGLTWKCCRLSLNRSSPSRVGSALAMILCCLRGLRSNWTTPARCSSPWTQVLRRKLLYWLMASREHITEIYLNIYQMIRCMLSTNSSIQNALWLAVGVRHPSLASMKNIHFKKLNKFQKHCLSSPDSFNSATNLILPGLKKLDQFVLLTECSQTFQGAR